MWGQEKRKTIGPNRTNARTPTKPRFTDFGAFSSSAKKPGHLDNRLSLSQQGNQPRGSLFQKGNSAAPRDVKQLANHNVAKIYQFFVENEGDDAPSEKEIRLPTKSSFIMMFEMIYQHVSKDYEFPSQLNRPEDEVMPIFKGLGCPVTLKSSSFNPMGSSHGYPFLLDALGWLVDFVKTSNAVCQKTQDILFGDFLEQHIVQEKGLMYSWMGSFYKAYTCDRPSLENQEYLEGRKVELREFYKKSDDLDDMLISGKCALQQLTKECEELEADKGLEQQYKDDITRCRDDIRKATDFALQCDVFLKNARTDIEAFAVEFDKVTDEWNSIKSELEDIKIKIDLQKNNHGLSGEAVRKLNSENIKDKETLREKESHNEEVSKEGWRLVKKVDVAFKEQKMYFDNIIDRIINIVAGLDIALDKAPSPTDANSLELAWDTLSKTWIPQITEQMNKKRVEFERQLSRYSDSFAALNERNQMEQEKLEESKKKEAREERVNRKERDDWKRERLQMEQKLEQLENEKEVHKEKMQESDFLQKQIDDESMKLSKLELQLSQKRSQLERSLRSKIDMMVEKTATIEAEQELIHKVCEDVQNEVRKIHNK